MSRKPFIIGLGLSLALGAAAVSGFGALANDSTAELRTGGLTLTRSDAIEMRSEDLFISPTEVRVRYVFRNTSARDITTTVAFPMPDITTEGVDDMLAIPTEDPKNILGFSTLVDGRPVPMSVEQKVVHKGVDRTGYLRGLNVPLAPHLASTEAALDALPQARRDELVRLDLAVIDEFDAGKGWERHWSPRWTLKTAYHWSQTFPAGRDLVVEHRYTPSVGMSAGTMVGSPSLDRSREARAEMTAMSARYCMDSQFLGAVARAKAAARQEYPPFTEMRIAYVLVTGANWKKPIGDFHLTVDKGSPENLVSFCATGVRKTGPTRFEVRRTGFTPRRDLDILILKPLTEQGQ